MQDLLEFAARCIFVGVTIACLVVVLARQLRRPRDSGPYLSTRRMNEDLESLGDALRWQTMSRDEMQKLLKRRAAERAKAPPPTQRVYVLGFEGDVMASPTKLLRDEITAITAFAAPEDEVVVLLESGGGAVTHYGLAAAQLKRLRDKKLKVTVCVDRVAASGGYMMAAVADQIVAAPFAIVGSIGVVTQIPNVHRLLKKHDVEVHELTAGRYKRTATMVGEMTEDRIQKVQEELDDTHAQFIEFVHAERPKVDLERAATGEHWLAARSLELGLVDRILTSDDYLIECVQRAEVIRVEMMVPEPWGRRLMRGAVSVVDAVVARLVERSTRGVSPGSS